MREDSFELDRLGPPKIGDYEIIQKIGRGGMGLVYLAWQPSLERFVALKFLLPELSVQPEFVDRFRREARAAAGFRHPNIVSVHEVGELGGQVFFTMDFIEGRNLQEVLKNGPISWQQAARYCQGIARAIAYAHSSWFLHRDLKPSNVIIDLHDQPQVTDFGLVEKMEAGNCSGGGKVSQLMGSAAYLAPEQAAGRTDQLTAACDIHAMGIILYECLTGHSPFRGETPQETLARVKEHEPVPPRALGGFMPRDLEIICLKCLEKDPARRYLRAHELAEDLTRCLAGEPIRAKHPRKLSFTPDWMRKRAKALYAASVALCLTTLWGVMTLSQSRLTETNQRLAKQVEQLKGQLESARKQKSAPAPPVPASVVEASASILPLDDSKLTNASLAPVRNPRENGN